MVLNVVLNRLTILITLTHHSGKSNDWLNLKNVHQLLISFFLMRLLYSWRNRVRRNILIIENTYIANEIIVQFFKQYKTER